MAPIASMGLIMYTPGKIIIIGGGDPPVKTAETIDLNTGGGWQSTGSMQYARRQMNSTVLPDGKVLAIGGTGGAGFNNESGAVLAPELWDPLDRHLDRTCEYADPTALSLSCRPAA